MGQTGSGKSYLATAIANRWRRVLVFDPKGSVAMPNAVRALTFDDALRALPGRVIWVPTAEELPRARELWDELIATKIWNVSPRGYHGLVVHETFYLGNANKGWGPYYEVAHTQGRELFVPIIDCCQRPVGFPRETKSEATHVACFFLRDEDDRRSMAEVMGPAVIEPTPFSHDYWYCGLNTETVRMAAI